MALTWSHEVHKVCLAVQNLQILKGPLSLVVCPLNQKKVHTFQTDSVVFVIKTAGTKRRISLVQVTDGSDFQTLKTDKKMMVSMMSPVPHVIGWFF